MTVDTETLDYEAQRLQNIKDNQALLLSLGLSSPSVKSVGTSKSGPASLAKLAALKRSQALKKKKKVDNDTFKPEADAADDDNDDEEEVEARSAKRRRSVASSTASESSSLRRSSRSSRRVSRYGEDGEFDDAASEISASGAKRKAGSDRELQRQAKRLGKRTENPKQFGHIPGVEVGRCWASRMECSTDAIHAPTVAGISGNPQQGAWSIALSGGYPDDVDLGVAFTYTGCGGRDLKGTKQNPKNLRTAEQTYDQTFDWPLNAAIKRSAETKKPVRVIRGFKLPSPYAPVEGYRYDGLYVVEKAWMAKGLTKGLKVCRYAFKRMDGQPPLPQRDLEKELEEASAAANEEEK